MALVIGTFYLRVDSDRNYWMSPELRENRQLGDKI